MVQFGKCFVSNATAFPFQPLLGVKLLIQEVDIVLHPRRHEYGQAVWTTCGGVHRLLHQHPALRDDEAHGVRQSQPNSQTDRSTLRVPGNYDALRRPQSHRLAVDDTAHESDCSFQVPTTDLLGMTLQGAALICVIPEPLLPPSKLASARAYDLTVVPYGLAPRQQIFHEPPGPQKESGPATHWMAKYQGEAVLLARLDHRKGREVIIAQLGPRPAHSQLLHWLLWRRIFGMVRSNCFVKEC
mmetsp:Transcript_122564/g.243859  ORF Transcript_122564/g.243859 Transcript_122564/m.243859 type:complete len:242 (-) Transcript_122564:269-994(-)